DYVRVERLRDQAREHQHEYREDLQRRAEEAALTRVLELLRAQGFLHDRLIRTPVPHAENHRAENGADPGIHRVARGLDHVKEIGWQGGAKAVESADMIEPDQRQNDRTGEEHKRLKEVGVDDRFQTA